MALKERKTPFKKIVTSTGEELNPVVTLIGDKFEPAHIVKVDDYYACYIYSEEVEGYVLTPYITSEFHESLVKLPTIEE